jgi:hypothetical protein
LGAFANPNKLLKFACSDGSPLEPNTHTAQASLCRQPKISSAQATDHCFVNLNMSFLPKSDTFVGHFTFALRHDARVKTM